MSRGIPPTDAEEKLWYEILQPILTKYNVSLKDFENLQKRHTTLSTCRREVWYTANTHGLSQACIAMLHLAELGSIRFGILKYKATVLQQDTMLYEETLKKMRHYALLSARRLKAKKATKFIGQKDLTDSNLSNPQI